MKSVLQSKKECFVCGSTHNLQDHHCIYGTSNRKNSEKYGLKVWLCRVHHTDSPTGVHHNKTLDTTLKHTAQRYFEAHNGTREDFISIFGKSFITEDEND